MLLQNGPETLPCGTAGMLALLLLPTPICKSLQTIKHTMKYLSVHNHHPDFSKKIKLMISLPNNSDFANLREYTIDPNNRFFYFFLTAINMTYFLQYSVNVGGASCAHTGCAVELGQGEQGVRLKTSCFLGNYFIPTLSKKKKSQIASLFNHRNNNKKKT